jgi:hypothetical protein
MMERFPGMPVYPYFLALFLGGLILVIARMIKERTWRNPFH